jgi:hypothetical protein
MNGPDVFLANAVWVFHVLVVLFVLLAPFSDMPIMIILHIAFVFNLLIHWFNNSNVCSLSIIESKLRGIPYTSSFTHQFVSPMFDISESNWSKLSYFITLILLGISFYNLYHSRRLQRFKECYNETRRDVGFWEAISRCMPLLMK